MKIPIIFFLVCLASTSLCDDRSRADGAASALMKYFTKDGVIEGWWTGACAFTSIMDYMILTGSKQYLATVEKTFVKNRKSPGTKDFTNEFVDDSGWWGLAWVTAYDLTKEKKYLDMAAHIADFMYTYRDNVCNGGLYWKTDRKQKNAIENELFIKLAAALHNRLGGETKYLGWAKEVWNWFKGTGMIRGDHLIMDGIKGACKAQGATFSYNQGVILGGLVELYKATKDHGYLNEAKAIANAATASSNLNKDGVLKEGGDTCKGDGTSFKGAFVKNLGELSRELGDHPYHAYLEKNAASAYQHARNNNNEYGDRWAAPFKNPGLGCQHSALDVMNAALKS